MQGVDLGNDEVLGELGGLGGQDLDRAVLGQDRRGLRGVRAEREGDRVTDPAGQGQQLQGGLADGTIDMIDVDEDFSHGNAPAWMREETGSCRGPGPR